MTSARRAIRIYRAMLRALPAHLRLEYGPRMERAFLEQLAVRRGRWRRLAAWLAAGGDVALWAVRGRIGSPGLVATARDPTRRRGGGMGMGLGSIGNDLRYAVRVLRRQPAFAAVVVAVAALGIGANTAIFTVVNELLLRPLPVEEPETLVDIVATVPGGNSFTGFALDDVRDLRERAEGLVGMAAFTAVRRSLGGRGDGRRLTVQISSSDYFDLLGLQTHRGRLSFPAFRGFGADPLAIVSHAAWTRIFGADPALVGSTIELGGQVLNVIGIAPAGFTGTFVGFPVDVWVPLSMAAPLLPGTDLDSRGAKRFEVLGRIEEGQSRASLEERLNVVLTQLEAEHPTDNRGLRASVYPTTGIDHSMRASVVGFLAVLTSVALLVLAIACLNIGSLLLARAITRDREVAIRLAVGAGAGRIVSHVLMEALVLVGAATVVALWLGRWLTDRLQDFAIMNAVPIGFDLAVDHRVLGLTVAVALATAVGAAGAPALHNLRKSPAAALRTSGATSGGRARLRGAFVVSQVAASVVLLIGAGLFVRALRSGLQMDVGLDASRIAVVPVTLDVERYRDPEGARAFGSAALAAATAVRGVEGVTLADVSPIGVGRTPTLIGVPGHEAPPGEEGFFVDGRAVGPRYFEIVGIPLPFGRSLPEESDGATASVVVSEAFVARFWPGQDPLGRFIDVEGRPHTVVGVAADARYLIQDRTPDPLVYRSWRWEGARPFSIVARADDPGAALLPLADAISALDPSLPSVRPSTVEDTLGQSLLPQRVAVAVLGILGALGLVLTSVGVYGVVQFSVSRASHEMGVRMALGGGARHVIGIILRRGLLFIGLGAVLGVAIALLTAPALESFLVGVSAFDPATYLGVMLVLILVGLVASGIPAIRAVRIDPADALRAE